VDQIATQIKIHYLTKTTVRMSDNVICQCEDPKTLFSNKFSHESKHYHIKGELLDLLIYITNLN